MTMLTNYQKRISFIGILSLGIFIGAIFAGIALECKYGGGMADMETDLEAVKKEVKLLKVEETHILRYALRQYREELKFYYEYFKEREKSNISYFDKGGQDEKK